MNVELIKKIQNDDLQRTRPVLHVGDFVEVDTIIRDGERKRIQKFKGIVISIKGSGTDRTFTVRKISYGVGVEKIFPLYSTNIERIKITRHSKVRKSKLYYMRERVGKAALKLKSGSELEESELEEIFDERSQENNVEPAISTDTQQEQESEQAQDDKAEEPAKSAETAEAAKEENKEAQA